MFIPGCEGPESLIGLIISPIIDLINEFRKLVFNYMIRIFQQSCFDATSERTDLGNYTNLFCLYALRTGC